MPCLVGARPAVAWAWRAGSSPDGGPGPGRRSVPFMPHATRPVPGALACLCYAVAGYLLMLAVTGYAIGFFAGAGVPKGIDQGAWSPWPLAVAIDAGLLLLFAVQHTVMARPWFKRRWTRLVPAPAERATFVVAASLALALLFWLWQIGRASCRERV